ncbi:putative spermidine/putrescine transport system substrate-binding protein [Roseovarius nanhaiticus]|uniref:Putative spermidine/putrescine transport system substrate-binding protein n=1 Tax=Roseovarius nanhaiticus TaxID=573024 RepID=A0A1N7EMI6_9RHOB|nr:ABC transporter substrate-binding protein [Roseovarius nanhaiticus]SEK71373.1 putative spermidine/putrescine transport system substrate-binding protein [Roseovarius nanhaiticus]SIR89280.1 putative spermidine/putrescine transport system substrate-binding protein [Roseovarius nanhaiticus]
MKQNQTFTDDQLELLAQKARTGKISRRKFAQLGAALLGTAALASRGAPVLADDGQIVFVSWGGDAVDAYDDAYGKPFEEATGIRVRQDGSGPTEGAIQAQFESGSPSWDIVDADAFSAETLGKKGMMEPIDYSVVDKSKTREGFGWEYAASSYFFSYIIAYDATKFGDNPPTSMADFFDTETYPGKRSMYKWGAGMWEALLMGDGVAQADLYPLDIERAHAKLQDFKEHVISFWGNGAESQSLMLDGEASMALIWSTRARLLDQDTDGEVSFIWQDGILSPGTMAVIKGNPGGADAAMKFIASAQDPEKQLVMFDMLSQGPANPAADDLIPEDQRKYNPVAPDNFAKQIPLDVAWYEENYGAALDEYLAIISA